MDSPQYQKCYTEPACDQNTSIKTYQEPKVCYKEPECEQNTSTKTYQEPNCHMEPTCDQNTSFKTCQEPKCYPEPETAYKTCQEPVRKVDCEYPRPTTKTGQFHKCCTLSPVAPTPLIRVDCCEKLRPCRGNFCTSVNADCDDFELTPFGKEFVLRTGKLIKNCICVKLNGLQDSCKHAGCCTRIGCMDVPFPNCPPARLWKNEYICRNKIRPNSCPDIHICNRNKK
ncbi:uncharacterized protein LOC100574530 isoform X3 [Acyrthosiphon pisum]|uniref:Uncharacterized protein n=1 Tax=Acyrthosiphon pisum TaxID=7029 RepID=A0A8R2B3I6_ACYPI|nr:uncharacterized protein LOC100574530 isoform X3 [Acyrthosiphon pisum]|eukprot:XP_008179314.1 PREDICTED: uncharacterized protein LOC100574530 isoform X3 [Acyrthosiphon pisum]